MKTTLLLVCAIASIATADAHEDPVHDLVQAIRFVESSNLPDHRVPRGKAGEIGPLQITEAYWIDSGVQGTWHDCQTLDYSLKVIFAYWHRYCPQALESGDLQTLARIHNGGPRGHRKTATLTYWRKIQSAMHRTQVASR